MTLLSQWMQANTTDKRNLVKFKNGLLEGLHDQQLMEQYLVFMPKMPQHESDIRAILALLERQQSQDRKKLKTTCTDSFETLERELIRCGKQEILAKNQVLAIKKLVIRLI